MPVSYTAPVAPVLPAAVGIDAEIQRLQLLLARELPWLVASYGRASRATQRRDGRTRTWPEVYAGGKEYRDVLPNDHVAAQSFWLARDPATNEATEPGAMLFTQVCDLIVWVNLEKVDPAKPYRFDGELLADVLRVLDAAGGVLVQRIYREAEEVFRGLTLEGASAGCLRAPYAGFRVQVELAVPGPPC